MKKTTLLTLQAGAASFALAIAVASAPARAQDETPPGATPATGPNTVASPAQGNDNQTIVVTGSRITNPNLVSTSPVTAVSNEDFKLQGTTRVEDLLNSLPQVYASQSSGIANGADGTATLNLRNLGDTRTLVLVNGRRLPPGDPSRRAGDSLGSAADVNNIPAFMIKRVDVLTGGASAAYGADAVAGVVNFILDEDLQGLRVDVQGNLSVHTNGSRYAGIIAADPRNFGYPVGQTADGATYDAGVAYGTKFADGRGHIEVYGSYHHQDPVLQDSRDYSSCSFTSNGTANFATAKECIGSRNSAVANFITNGGIGDTGAGVFIIDPTTGGRTTRGFQNSDRYNYAPTNYYQRPDTRYNAGLFAHFDVSDAFRPYVNFIYMNDRSKAQIAPSGTFGNLYNLNCSNPLLSPGVATDLGCTTFGPGSTQVVPTSIFKRNVEGGARVDDLRHEDYRIMGGFKGDLGKTWDYDIYAQYGKTKYNEVYLNDFSFARTRLALNNCQNPDGTAVGDTACVPYNIFTGTTTIQPTTAAGVTQAGIDYVNTPGRKSGYTSEFVISGVLNGKLGDYGIQSPFASEGVSVAIGGEYRREKLVLNTDAAYATGDLLGQGGETKPASGKYNVKEGFIEVAVPLISDRPFFNKLDVDGAYRYSSYTTVGHTNTWKFGVAWQPFQGAASALHFRGSINRAVRAPTLQDFFSPNQLGLGGSGDTCADNAGSTDPDVVQGCLNTGRNDPNFASQFQTLAANPASQYNERTEGAALAGTALRPEVAITKTLGALFTPREGFLRGFTASVDYYQIDLRNTIKADGYDTIFSQCFNTGSNYYCDLIKRDPTNGSLWLGPGGYINNPIYNAGRLKTSGIDFAASYALRPNRYGRFSLAFTGSYLLDEKVQVLQHNDNGTLSSLGSYNCVGYFGDNCGSAGNGGEPSPKWRSKLRLSWADPSGGVGFSVNWRYTGPSKWEALDPNPLQPASVTNGANAPGPLDRIKAVNYIDMVLTFNVQDKFQLRVGVTNVLDRDPPIINGGDFLSSQVNGNTFPGYYDTLGRQLFAGITTRF